MRNQGLKEPRCVPVQITILESEVIQIFLQWAVQNPYFPRYGIQNVKFPSSAIEQGYRMRILSAE